MSALLFCGDAAEVLRDLLPGSVNCCVTSPPYWGLRAYQTSPQIWGGDAACEHIWASRRYYTEKTAAKCSADAFCGAGEGNAARLKEGRWREDGTCELCGAWRGELGLEPTPELYVQHLVAVFREVRRVLREDGTLWLNLGDSYSAASTHGGKNKTGPLDTKASLKAFKGEHRVFQDGLKPKDLVGIPWRAAFALQADGWYLRSDIIWSKPNPMPESVRDRPTKAHEYVFLLARSGKTLLWQHRDTRIWVHQKPEPDYVYRDRLTGDEQEDEPENWRLEEIDGKRRWSRINLWRGFDYYYDADAIREPHSEVSIARALRNRFGGKYAGADAAEHTPIKMGAGYGANGDPSRICTPGGRNHRTVWTITPQPYAGAHFATFPEALVEPCILAGCPQSGTVLDPFCGSGTVGKVCQRLGRQFIGIDLNADYIRMSLERIGEEAIAV